MIRLIILILIAGLAAFGLGYLFDLEGQASLTLNGLVYETSPAIAALGVFALAIAIAIVWSLVRFVFRLPSLISLGLSARRRHKGHLAISRGMIALGSGDQKHAEKHAKDARRLLGTEPLALLLSAQSAQLSGQRTEAERAFRDMLAIEDTRLLGLRGLFIEAQRSGDNETAFRHAQEAAALFPKAQWPWEALLDHHAKIGAWREALQDLHHLQGHLDKAHYRRKRAVLLTAEAMHSSDATPEIALEDLKEAVKLAPDLVPASTAYARLLSRRGDYRKASKILEAAWSIAAHPDIAEAYVSVRSGDAARERLARAEKLFKLRSDDADARYALAHTALAAREFDKARDALAPLLTLHPSVRICLLMADIEDAEHGTQGHVREWLARASRAPRDAAWIADGVIADHWAPISPVTGKIDAFQWARPREILADRRVSQALDGAPRAALPEPIDITPEPVKAAPEPKLAMPVPALAKPAKPQAEAVFPAMPIPDDPGPDGARDENDDPRR